MPPLPASPKATRQKESREMVPSQPQAVSNLLRVQTLLHAHGGYKLHKAGEPHCLPALSAAPATGLLQLLLQFQRQTYSGGLREPSHGVDAGSSPQAGLHLGVLRFLQGSWWAWGTPCLCKEGFSIRHRSTCMAEAWSPRISSQRVSLESLDCWRLPSMAEKWGASM